MVPVVLLTGFLGSGKTTLLNRILAGGSPVDGTLAVIVNEFGDVGVDGDLLPEGMSRQVELPGGCICCMLDEDLEKTITELLEPVDGEPSDVSLIVIETTGIAEPIPISWSLADEALGELVRLAAIVTTVDACEHDRHRPVSGSVDAQVDDADIIVVTKGDLASTDEVEALIGRLRERNGHAPILAAGSDEAARWLRVLLADPTRAESAITPTKPANSHEHSHASLESRALPIRHTLDYEELADQLAALPPNFLRIKGIADVVDPGSGWEQPTRVAFHRVGSRVSVEQLPPSRGGEPRIVAVGYELKDDLLADCLRHAAIDSTH